MRRRTTTKDCGPSCSMPSFDLDTSSSRDSSVLALGRTAILGELYDASTNTFFGRTIFRRKPSASIFSSQDIRGISTETKIVKGLKDTYEFLGVDVSVALGAFSGLLEAEGTASYLKPGKSSKHRQSALMSYKIRTVRENLQTSVYELRQFLSYKALNTTEAFASHIVVGIEYGTDILIVASSTKTTGESQEDILGKIAVYFQKLEKLGSRISASADVKYHAEEHEEEFESSLQVFGDVSSSSLGAVQNFSQVLEFLLNVPALIERTNGGRGRAIKYFLFPQREFRRFMQPHLSPFTVIDLPYRSKLSISEAVLEEFLLLFDEIAVVRKEVDELTGKMRDHSICLTEEELTEIAELSSQFEKMTLDLKNKFKYGLSLVKTGKWRNCGSNLKENVHDANSYLNRIRTEWLAGSSFQEDCEEVAELTMTSKLTLANVKKKIKTGFSSTVKKIQLYEKFKVAGVAYIGRGGANWRVNCGGFFSAQEFLCQYPELVTFVLFFSSSSYPLNPKWLETLSLFLNQLNKGDNKLVAVDCDLCPVDLDVYLPNSSSSSLPVIHEYFDGKLISFNVLLDFEFLPQGQGSGQIKVPAFIYPDGFLTLGALFDAQTGKFLDNQNLFGNEKLSTKLVQTSSSSRIIQSGNVVLNSTSKFKELFKALQIPPSLALELLLENHQAGSSGGQTEDFLEYFIQAKKSCNRISGAVIHTPPNSISVEYLNLDQVIQQTNCNNNKETDPVIDKTSLFNNQATHFIKEIHFGNRWILHLSINNHNSDCDSDSEDSSSTSESAKQNLKNSSHILAVILQKVGHIVIPKTSSPIDLNFLAGDQVVQNMSPIFLDLFCLGEDASTDSFYIQLTNFSDFETSLKQSLNKVIVSKMEGNCKVPLVYILDPIENLQRPLGLCLGRPSLRPTLNKKRRENDLWLLVNLFNKLGAGERELLNMKDKLEKHAEAVTDDDWREFETIQQDFSNRADQWKNQFKNQVVDQLQNLFSGSPDFHLKEFLRFRLDKDQVKEDMKRQFRSVCQKMEILREIRKRRRKWVEKVYYIGEEHLDNSLESFAFNQPLELGTTHYVLGIKKEFLSPSKLYSESPLEEQMNVSCSFWKNLEYFFELSALIRPLSDEKTNQCNTSRSISSVHFLLIDEDARKSLPFFLLSPQRRFPCPPVIVEYKLGVVTCGDVWMRDKEQEAEDLKSNSKHGSRHLQPWSQEKEDELGKGIKEFLFLLKAELEAFSRDLRRKQEQFEIKLETLF